MVGRAYNVAVASPPSNADGDGVDALDRQGTVDLSAPQMFTSIRGVRGFEEVAGQIERAIASGTLKSGERLPNEHVLSSMFGVSRTTLREAIRAIEASGIDEVRRGAHGGIFVTEPGVSQAANTLITDRFRGATTRDLAEVQGSFEAETAFWAAKHATDEDIAELERIVAEYAAAAKAGDRPWTELVALILRSQHVARWARAIG